jgi:uncharacterized protein YndB with AHSA1/START domain
MSDDLGTIERSDGRYALRMVRHLSRPPTDVWAALTEPARLERWLGTTTLELRPGGAIEIVFDVDSVIRGTVRAVEPEKRLEYTWCEGSVNDDASVVCFELSPDGEGTLLTLTHRHQPASMARRTAAGWHAHVDVLAGELMGDAPSWESRYEQARGRYQALVATVAD